MTLEEMGLYERLSSHNDVRWHRCIPEGQTSKEVRIAANAAEVYISSVNGLAETGEIINIRLHFLKSNNTKEQYYGIYKQENHD